MRNRQQASREEQPTTSKSGGAISNKRVRSSNGQRANKEEQSTMREQGTRKESRLLDTLDTVRIPYVFNVLILV